MTDSDYVQKEFRALDRCYKILTINLNTGTTMSAERLLAIREQIENCDEIVDGNFQIISLHKTHRCWERHRQRLEKKGIIIPPLDLKTKKSSISNEPNQPKNKTRLVRVKVAPKPSFDDTLSPEDRRWLRSRGIDDEDPWGH